MTAPAQSARHVDIVVVGAGTAGAATARGLARDGWRVLVVDRRPRGAAGARWCNGIVPWQFERAGVPVPSGDELRSRGGRTHMYSPSGRRSFTVDNPIWEADMRLLGERLVDDAEAAGAGFEWEVTDVAIRCEGGRPAELTGTNSSGDIVVSASLFVDASGRRGVVRGSVPSLRRDCPPPAPSDLCSAQQLSFGIADRTAAERFLDAHDAEPGDAVNWMSPMGGYSVVVMRVEDSFDEVSVLTGAVADGRHGTGPGLMRVTLDRHPWIGPRLFGGGALIPLRRAYDRLAGPGVALVGDAACQVFPVHGSGIGYGLLGAHTLAAAVRGASDPGGLDVMWRYQSTFLREFGGTLAGYDAIRHMSADLGSDGVETMFEAGLLSAGTVEPGLRQQRGLPSPRILGRQVAAVVSSPRLVPIALPALMRMGIAPLLYRMYPRRVSESALRRWSWLTRQVLGPVAESPGSGGPVQT